MRPDRPTVDADADLAPTRLRAGLADAADLLAGDSAVSRTFIGGLVLGALAGAVLAGATLARTRGRERPSGPARR